MKEPKKQARELIDKYRELSDSVFFHNSKQCALIYATEQSVEMNNSIIELTKQGCNNECTFDYLLNRYEYWQEVKTEINKL